MYQNGAPSTSDGRLGTESTGLLQSQSQSPAYAPRTQDPPGLSNLAAGGAKVEESLTRIGLTWQVMFFISSCGVMFAALVGAVGALGTLEIAAFVDELFLFLFGGMVFIMDIPGNPRWSLKYRQWIRKYMRVLTRISGTSVWCLFLGTMVLCSLWPSSDKILGKNLLLLIAIVISFVVVAASVMGFFISAAKSMRLRDTHRAIRAAARGNYQEVYRKYALASPHIGLRMDEFNRLCSDCTSARTAYPLSDLAVIYNALEGESAKDALNEQEFVGWLQSGLVLL